MVILRFRRVCRLAISAVRWLLPAPGPSKSARLQSTSSTTNATNTCRSSKRRNIALFGDHKPANVVVGIATMSPGYLIEVDAIAIID